MGIDYDGSIIACCQLVKQYPTPLGNVLQRGVREITRDPEYKRMVEETSHCNLCLTPNVVERVDNILMRRLLELVEDPLRAWMANKSSLPPEA